MSLSRICLSNRDKLSGKLRSVVLVYTTEKLKLIVSASAKLCMFLWIARIIKIYSKNVGLELFYGYKAKE